MGVYSAKTPIATINRTDSLSRKWVFILGKNNVYLRVLFRSPQISLFRNIMQLPIRIHFLELLTDWFWFGIYIMGWKMSEEIFTEKK